MKSATTLLLEKLLEQLPENYTVAERELVQRAYWVAEEAHREQKRHSGEPYINHCLAVAGILSELKVPSEVIAAGLLHDTVEDTNITLADLRRDFGDTIASLVDGVTKLTHLPRVSRGDQHAESEDNGNEEVPFAPASLGRKEDIVAETLRKTFLAMGEDVRVMFIKLADRLHNIRTLSHMPEHKRKRIAQETLDIFAPVANRLGIWQIKWELEDLGFRYVDPEKYTEIAELLSERRPDREAQLESIKENVAKLLEQNNIKAEISGRTKHIYSIYKKMLKKDKPFDMVRDVRAVRLIVTDVPSCYAALGVIHITWRPMPGEFKDYIAAPKDNLYQSLHTTVFYDDKRPLEVQIRTQEMHLNAEYGIAAHWQYKEGTKRSDKNYEKLINSLRSKMELKSDVGEKDAFVELLRSDVLQDRIYIFTPRGDIIDLPAGSTPIDFAYHIHTEVGHRCRGARVGKKRAPLDRELKTGDLVEIITVAHGGPSHEWLNPNLNFVKSHSAKNKIRAWHRQQEQYLLDGEEILKHELQKQFVKTFNYEKISNELGFTTPKEMFIAIGCGVLTANKVILQNLTPTKRDEF
jgi:GTP diphosphokinase / guanosine-3',5'-bis(diphosphate) 3'-diphosphatase